MSSTSSSEFPPMHLKPSSNARPCASTTATSEVLAVVGVGVVPSSAVAVVVVGAWLTIILFLMLDRAEVMAGSCMVERRREGGSRGDAPCVLTAPTKRSSKDTLQINSEVMKWVALSASEMEWWGSADDGDEEDGSC